MKRMDPKYVKTTYWKDGHIHVNLFYYDDVVHAAVSAILRFGPGSLRLKRWREQLTIDTTNNKKGMKVWSVPDPESTYDV